MLAKKILTNRLLFYPLTLAVIIGCSSFIRIKPKHKGIDSEFSRYVNSFIHRSRGKVANVENLTMGFDILPTVEDGQIVGTCSYVIPNLAEIDIHYPFWINSPSVKREFLIYHEMIHCMCHSLHRNKMKKDGCPESIMHEKTMPVICSIRHYRHYVKEMFDGC